MPGADMRESGADLILVGGTVLTMDPAAPQAAAVAVKDGRIVAVGADKDVLAWSGPTTRILRVTGGTVTPGLVDAHAHLLGLGTSLETVSLRGAATEEEAAARAGKSAAALPAGEWVLGRGWDQNLWPGKKFPTAAVLDKAVGGRPAALRRVDGHAVWVSSAALAAAGVDRSTQDPPGGKIVRDAEGRPTGVLVDNAMDLIDAKIPAPQADVVRRRLLRGARAAVAVGLTSIHDMGISDATADVYRNLADEARLPIRVYAYLLGSDAKVAQSLSHRIAEVDRSGAQMFVLRGLKLYADGALGSRGARLLAPYSDDPKNQGLWVTPPGELQRDIEAATQAGWQVAVHAIGDAANRAVLDDYAAVDRAQPGRAAALRLRVEHAQVVALSDLPRFAKLGVIASMQPTHATSDMPWAEARVGPERIKGAYAWKTLLDSGAHLAFGSDFPVEEPSPLLGLYAAVTRQDPSGNPAGGWYPDQRLTLDQALRAFTVEAAYAAFAETQRGMIKPGMVADITVFDRPLRPDKSLLETRVSYTIVGGKVVYERPH